MQIEFVKMEKLNPAKYNPRKISKDQMEALKTSLSEFGFVDPAVVNSRNRVIVGGHQRIEAWKALGNKTCPVVFVDLDDQQEKALNLALNKISGEWDDLLLKEVILDLKEFGLEDFTFTGFSTDEIDQLIGTPEIVFEESIDETPAPPENPKTKPGDIYHIGNHVLMCGDSTNEKEVKRLISDRKIDCVFTDPPYGISLLKNERELGSSSQIYEPIIGDENTDVAKAAIKIIQSLRLDQVFIWGGNYFTDFLPPSSCWIVWRKQPSGVLKNEVFNEKRFKTKTENQIT